jgi:hypothetical protein
MSARYIDSSSVAPDLHLHWTNPSTGAVVEINVAGAPIDVRAEAPQRNDTAAGIVALELAARDHRAAIELDRSGNYRASRNRFRQAADMLMRAPDSDDVRELRVMSSEMASQSGYMAMTERDRKHTVHQAHRRSRGRRQS